MNGRIINQVVILSLIMIVGLYSRKKGYLNKEVNKGLSELLINVTLPFLILTSFNQKFSGETAQKFVQMFIYGILINIMLIFLSKLLSKGYEKTSRKVIRFAIVFSNSAFMGYPVLEGIYGSIGVFYAAIFNLTFNIFLMSFGVMVYTEEKDKYFFKKVIVQPGIIATVLGMLMFVFSIKIPDPFFKSINLIGSMTTPLSMLIIGSMLAETKFKEIFKGRAVYYTTFIRLLIAPLATFILLKAINADAFLLKVSVIIEAMPVAVMASVFAEKYGADAILASRCVFITTVLSMATIPIVVMLVG